jgi:hypothetical protein
MSPTERTSGASHKIRSGKSGLSILSWSQCPAKWLQQGGYRYSTLVAPPLEVTTVAVIDVGILCALFDLCPRSHAPSLGASFLVGQRTLSTHTAVPITTTQLLPFSALGIP